MDRRRGGSGAEPVNVLAVAADDDAERSLLAFAASEEHPDDVLILARAKRMTAQDASLGQDTYCLVTGSSGARHYGGIDAVEWTSPDRLRLSLTRDAAETLQLPRDLVLVLPDAGAVDVVRAGLPSLLGPTGSSAPTGSTATPVGPD